jgi:hypothetical protein
MHDLTDEETIDRVAFDLKWHFALNLSEGKAGDVYVCPKTLWTGENSSVPIDQSTIYNCVFQTRTGTFAREINRNRPAPQYNRHDPYRWLAYQSKDSAFRLSHASL